MKRSWTLYTVPEFGSVKLPGHLRIVVEASEHRERFIEVGEFLDTEAEAVHPRIAVVRRSPEYAPPM